MEKIKIPQQMMDDQRRHFIKSAISTSTLALVAASGLLLPQKVLANWDPDAFNAETVEDALLALLGQATYIEDEKVLNFKVGAPPSYAVNGASVPIEIHSNLKAIERIAILVAENPRPLAMSLEPSVDFSLPFKCMIKVAKDSKIMAVIRADGQLYKTSRAIKVDIGGCG